ncbi:MAG: DUF421 domain-containing protein [Oscillospiraceae bacterium]|nr:DUF421 domain-containing protein [Oscillospiraceae bacterium]
MAISIIRTLILYLAIIVSMRVMGKRQLGELEPAELVVAVLISELAANPLQDLGTPLLYGLAPVLTLVFCETMVSAVMLKNVRLRAFICGKPSFIVLEGRLMQDEMRKNRYSLDELSEQLRKRGILDISTVKFAILETDGTLSTIPYSGDSPATPNQMQLQVCDADYPITVVSDGRVLLENLRALGFDEAWLKRQLRGHKAKSPKEVFIMSADKSGRVYFAAKETAQ